ncbi:hypothetical protein F4779DRAFT_451101 [Xylariaceae sp. FL0662B]|nr:hypothetical protein F4779DRAFT_451101 [Xylariaceae sp. FL0662B]
MEQTPDEDQWAYFSSEYADSFGVFSTDADWRWEDPDGVEVVHSGFTPILPYLQVSRYREEPSDLSPFPLPSYLRLDTLYYGEQLQQTVLSGLTIWKLAPFTGGVYVNSEDWMEPRRPRLALDGFVEGLLEVNEGTWPEFIKKDKWMDLLINPLESIQNPEWEWQTTYPNCWSVDNEIVWDCLRVSIECAVRILTTIITEQSEWLDTLLFQPSRRWQDIDPKMVFPEGTEARFIEPRKPEDRAKPAELWQRLEELNENTFFGFHDETMGYKRTGAWGGYPI